MASMSAASLTCFHSWLCHNSRFPEPDCDTTHLPVGLTEREGFRPGRSSRANSRPSSVEVTTNCFGRFWSSEDSSTPTSHRLSGESCHTDPNAIRRPGLSSRRMNFPVRVLYRSAGPSGPGWPLDSHSLSGFTPTRCSDLSSATPSATRSGLPILAQRRSVMLRPGGYTNRSGRTGVFARRVQSVFQNRTTLSVSWVNAVRPSGLNPHPSTRSVPSRRVPIRVESGNVRSSSPCRSSPPMYRR